MEMNLCYPCLRWTSMAPLDDLIHSVPIAFKGGLYTAVPTVFNPTFYPQSESHLMSMVAEKDSLNHSFNDYPCPYLFHIDLETITGSS